MVRKNILIFIDWYLPGYKAGGPIQSVVNLVSHLSGEANFYIITSNKDYCEVIPYPNLQFDTWVSISPNVKVYYLSTNKLVRNVAQKSIRELSPSAIYINGIYSFYYSFIPLWVANRLSYSGKLIVAPRGMLASTAIAVKSYKKKLFLMLANLLGSYRRVTFHATNTHEAQAIEQAVRLFKNIVIAPNLPKTQHLGQTQYITKEKGNLKLISVARIAPEKNILYALEVLKNNRYEGQIIFDLYGPIYNEVYWQQCMNVIDALPSNIKVNYRGAIENGAIVECIQNYHALFLPTQGENFGHAIFESFIANRPVIISTKTPWNNLKEKQIGFDIELETPSFFANTLQNLLNMEQNTFDEYVASTDKFVKDYYAKDAGLALNKALFLS